MNENAKQWVAALRSGKYKQGREYLGTIDGEGEKYCCLGVACELAVNTGLIPKGHREQCIVYANKDDVLPMIVQDWLGLQWNTGAFILGGQSESLGRCNDFLKMSFEEIADIIESEPPGLFK